MTTFSAAPAVQEALDVLGGVILGKPTQLRLALTCLLARGHLLIEDLPGVGKTTLALALARVLGLEFGRVQFTSDLLPADLSGVNIFQAGEFRFVPGPLFTQLLLADELNRATPKTQSALLEAMEERQVSLDGVTHALPEAFFVIGTQNPSEQVGTYPLPESQLDRFLLAVTLGYPDPAAERALLSGGDTRDVARHLRPVMDAASVLSAQREVAALHVSPALIDYVLSLLSASRESQRFAAGLSPRAALGLLAAARAWAWLDGRTHVLPEDIQAVFPALARHRLLSRAAAESDPEAVQALLRSTAIP